MSHKSKKRKSLLWFGLLVFVFGSLLGACSKTEDSNTAVIKTVLEHEFFGPDEKLMDLMWNPKYKTVVNDKEENKELDQYLEEKYGPYFTDNGLYLFVAAFGGTSYQTFAHDSGYTLNLKSVDAEQNKDLPNFYTFTAKVGYQKGDEKEKTGTVQGNVTFSENEKGEMTKFQYDGDDELRKILQD
ncbi:hypothetical protein GJU40_16200 [Bacillus lacus]|uniref:Lipoprotein n=1 Tax=Metabacillus lacus TaxID=1983721 RepID=A0A7X2M145_9BACI|nr:hypothetical protein [Metabacillus lacus]MRX73684.1 hypothetical protein [Metabacillus lacus]